MNVNGEAIRRVQDRAKTLRVAVRGAIGWVAAGWLMAAPAVAQAQDLPSKPLNWIASLPAAVSSSLPPPADGNGRTSFLKGRFLAGVTVTHGLTPEDYVGSRWSVSPFFRNTPRRVGWGPSFGLNWFTGDIDVLVDGVRTTIGEVRVRPIMAGIGYTLDGGRARTTLSLVGGYAFARARVTAALPEGTTASISITDSWVVRPNVGVTVALTKRLALVGSIGYIYTNPTITVDVTRLGRTAGSASGAYRADYVNITVGTAVSIF
jgi:hypothetical protein